VISAVLRQLALLLAAVLVAACGAGVGGTGTGNVYPPQVFGATAAPLCGSALSSTVDCGAGGQPSPTGAALTLWASDDARVRVRVEGDSLELEARCDDFDFVGDWGVLGNSARFWGTLTRASGVAPGTAVASVTGDGRLVVELRDTAGSLVFGPVSLARVSAWPARACP
jgi:hypothetical protein